MQIIRSPQVKLIYLSLLPAAVAFLGAFLILTTKVGILPQLPYEFIITPDLGDTPSLEDIRKLPDHAWSSIAPDSGSPDAQRQSHIRGSLDLRTIWLRHRIRPMETPESRIFSIPLLFVHSINFYTESSPSGEFTLALAGTDRDHWYDRNQPSLKINASPSETTTVLIELRPTRGLKTSLSIQPEPLYQQLKETNHLYVGLIQGGSAFLIIFGMALFISSRSLIYLYSVAFQLFIAIGLLVTYGDIFEYFPLLASNPAIYQQVVIQISIFAILFFGLCLIESSRHLVRADKIRSRWTAEVGIVFALVLGLPYIPETFQFGIMIVILVISLIEAILFLATRPDPDLNIRQIALMGSSFWSAFSLTIGSIVGRLGNSIYIENAIVGGQFIVATMLVIDFSRRMNLLNEERIQAISQLRADLPNIGSPKEIPNLPTKEHEEFDVTMMFIDIMSFSVISEKLGPESVFNDLSERLRHLTDVIESHGGTIDRSLGDGLLCFFSASDTDHTLRAFQASVKIHENILRDAMRISSTKSKRALMPVRIGIHTDKVVIGNIVGSYQIDFTMVGNGVNFASNLEQACGPFQIVVSKEVYDKLSRTDFSTDQFFPIQIAVKHKPQLFDAYRHNPFSDRQNDVNFAMNLHYNQLGVLNRERRFQLKTPGSITLISAHGNHRILDFSLQGFRATSEVILGQNAIFEAELHLADPIIARNLRDKFLHTLTLEVRWSRMENGQILQGFKIVGANEEQCHFRVAQFLSIVSDLDKAG